MRRLSSTLIATVLAATTGGGGLGPVYCQGIASTARARSEGSAAASSAPGVRRVVASRSDRVTARVISTRPMFRTEPGSSAPTPAITSGSGITLAGWWLFAAQDDSSLVAAKGTDGSLEAIRVFPSVEGYDRFSEAFGNKSLKPDLEAALTVPVPARLAARFGATPTDGLRTHEAVLLVGSGSKRVLRDRLALIFPAASLEDSRAVAVRAERFYERLRREPALVGRDGDLNVEGVALVRRGSYLRFFNRGNGKAGSVAGSVDVPLDDFLAYLARAAAEPATPFSVPLSYRRTYDLGRTSDGEPVGITDAITLPPLAGAPPGMAGEIRVLSAIAERSAAAEHDGRTSDAAMCLQLPDGRILVAPLRGVEGAERLKIEGLSVVSARWVGRPARLQLNLLAVTDADAKDPSTPSTLARVEVTFQPFGAPPSVRAG
jgi:hypothetical protein